MRILYVTTISLTMNSFFKPHIHMLVKEGHQVDIACNSTDLPLDSLYQELGCKEHQIDFSRNPLSLDNIKAYRQLREVIEGGSYDVVHCHTPNASVITRLVCRKFRKKGLKVFYTAHGFHFYKGAPQMNWLVYYPVEKICSRFTDKLVTINREDYALAKAKFRAKEVHYVPGVGIDLTRFENIRVEREAKRQELGIPKDAFLLLSVGELNENKNHQVVIKALSELHDPNIHYAIAGDGDKHHDLLSQAKELGICEQVHLLGYRKDVLEIFKAADLYVLPSIREGLNVSLMEAMANELPCVVGRIRGNVDLIEENTECTFAPSDAEELTQRLQAMILNKNIRYGAQNKIKVCEFSLENVLLQMKSVYSI